MLNFLLTSVVWNTNYENNPENSDGPNFGAAEMRSDRKAVRERLEKEHTMNLLSGVVANDGYHKPGSSKDYYQADAPTLRPDGVTALTADDNGRKWIRSTDNTKYFYAHPTWVLYGSEMPLLGYEGVSLTEWATANTNKPEIASGSKIEVNGTLYNYAANTALTDEVGLADGWCYIKHDVSTGTPVPILTNTFGTWDTAKQGFYDGSGNRFSLFAMYRSGAITKIFTDKAELDAQTAKLGYWYYEKLYTGTTTSITIIETKYGIIFDETILPISNVVNVLGMVKVSSSPELWEINNTPLESESLSAIPSNFTYYKVWGSSSYNNKPYKAYIKYKFDL